MTKCEYNGWTNYETWCVNLWIRNEESTSRYWDEQAEWAYEREVRDKNRATYTLANWLRDRFNGQAPNLGPSCYSDLLNSALKEVNWQEIARHFIDDAAERAAKPGFQVSFRNN